ncbi:MAG: metal-sensitive transcriptional regulator [Gammaproteobacteria bacterium]|nr:metal-sensitive transcriptional regulator [Gammaproteobacteria bacterium]
MKDIRTGEDSAGHAIEGLSIQAFYPDHQSQLSRLARIDGQIKGITRMIEQRRYCIDIVNQIKAVQSALQQVQMGVLEKHLHHCVSTAAASPDSAELSEKIEEIVQVVGRM